MTSKRHTFDPASGIRPKLPGNSRKKTRKTLVLLENGHARLWRLQHRLDGLTGFGLERALRCLLHRPTRTLGFLA
jgi:hypothetical protein